MLLLLTRRILAGDENPSDESSSVLYVYSNLFDNGTGVGGCPRLLYSLCIGVPGLSAFTYIGGRCNGERGGALGSTAVATTGWKLLSVSFNLL